MLLPGVDDHTGNGVAIGQHIWSLLSLRQAAATSQPSLLRDMAEGNGLKFPIALLTRIGWDLPCCSFWWPNSQHLSLFSREVCKTADRCSQRIWGLPLAPSWDDWPEGLLTQDLQPLLKSCLSIRPRCLFQRLCFSFCSFSFLHEECLQPHLVAQPYHHVCHSAAAHLLHGGHEHHPWVSVRRWKPR